MRAHTSPPKRSGGAGGRIRPSVPAQPARMMTRTSVTCAARPWISAIRRSGVAGQVEQGRGRLGGQIGQVAGPDAGQDPMDLRFRDPVEDVQTVASRPADALDAKDGEMLAGG